MAYILDLSRDIKNPEEYQALKKFFDVYREYLVALGNRLPQSVRDFVLSDWYWQYDSHRCPYDGWLESINVREPSAGTRKEERSIEIEMLVLGPYHDGHIRYTYHDVLHYSLALPCANQRQYKIGHAGWKADEIRLSEEGQVIHEILFKSGARWIIASQTIEYCWLPLDSYEI